MALTWGYRVNYSALVHWFKCRIVRIVNGWVKYRRLLLCIACQEIELCVRHCDFSTLVKKTPNEILNSKWVHPEGASPEEALHVKLK